MNTECHRQDAKHKELALTFPSLLLTNCHSQYFFIFVNIFLFTFITMLVTFCPPTWIFLYFHCTVSLEFIVVQ